MKKTFLVPTLLVLLLSSCQSRGRHTPSGSTSSEQPTSSPTSEVTSNINTSNNPTSETTSDVVSTSHVSITSALPSSSEATSVATSEVTSNSVFPTSQGTSQITSAIVTSAPTSQQTSIGTSLTPTSQVTSAIVPSSSNPTSTGTSVVSTSEPPISDLKILGITIRTTTREWKVSSSKLSLWVDYDFNDGYSADNVDNSVNWESLNTSVATIDQYGRVTGVSKGKCIIRCTTVVDARQDELEFYIYESESDIEKSWKKMLPTDQLAPKDEIIIACPQKGKAATSVDTGHKLASTTVTFNDDQSVMTNVSDAAQFYVGLDDKGRDGFNLEIETEDKPKYLGASNKENVSFFDSPKSSQTLWTIDYDYENSCWDMRPATNVDGWMMYNSDIDKFANYLSNETAFMFVVSLYRYTRTIKL